MRIIIQLITFSLLSIALMSCASMQNLSADAIKPIQKSPADNRSYRALTLENGLRVMLVSDANADMAAAALDVNVGSGHDPKDRQGLAHYLEHMLFLGTEKYPEAGEYQQYISEHGGSNNAYTSLNHTNYFFSITPDNFEGALDRFSQFFITPLFNEAYVKRERSIVFSEYKARKNDESRRLWTARRTIYNPEHPSTQFSVGSLDTLADRENDLVRDDLIAFYEQFYRAPRMALSLIGSQSLDQLQAWVESKFAAILSSTETYTPFEKPLVRPDQLPIQLRLKPIKERRSVNFSFPIDSIELHVHSKPSVYLSNLIGHEGAGSLLAALKSRAWANSLSAGLGYSDDVQATFDINISLSEEGFQHINEIGELLFSTFDLIRKQGVKQSYFDELKQLADIDFRFQEKVGETALVQRLASQLHRFDAHEVLATPNLYSQYDAEQIRKILDRLRPRNLQLVIIDPSLESEHKTQWYDVAYAIDEIDPRWLARWRQAEQQAAITLPEPNPFVPQELAMIERVDADLGKPEKIKSAESFEIWHQSQTQFDQPKSALYFTLRSGHANDSARNNMLTELYVVAVEEALGEVYYPAYLAGLEYRIYQHSRGLSVRLNGYSERQAQLLNTIIDTLQTVEVDQQQFNLYIENIRRGLENELKGRPSNIVISGLYDVLLSSSWSIQERLEALGTLGVDALEQHKQVLLTDPELLVLSIGNVTQQDSIELGEVVALLATESLSDQAAARARVRKLESANWALRPIKAIHDDAAIALVYQGSSDDMVELAATQLIGSLIRTPYYQTLRTEAEVGYIVSAFAFNLLDTPALGFSVQSNSHSVNEILAQTDGFIRNYSKVLLSLPDELYESTKAGLIARLEQEDKQLSDIAARYWQELDRGAFDFDSRERLVSAIRAIDKNTLAAYFKDLTASGESDVLLSYSFGAKSGGALRLPTNASTSDFSKLADARQTLNDFF